MLNLALNSRIFNLKYEGYFQNTFSVSTEDCLFLDDSVRAVVICPKEVGVWTSAGYGQCGRCGGSHI